MRLRIIETVFLNKASQSISHTYKDRPEIVYIKLIKKTEQEWFVKKPKRPIKSNSTRFVEPLPFKGDFQDSAKKTGEYVLEFCQNLSPRD